jgi:serine/threonine-protein kinase
MALREKFGRLVLLEETDADSLGREYRAARLGPAGLDRLVVVQRFGPSLAAKPDAARRLMDQARFVARLQNPGLVRLLGIGRVDQSYYISSELVEGRTLKSILERCRQESFPFAVDHALMVASRTASALEYAHAKKDEAGGPLCHGLLAPSRIVVAFDGEVKVKGLGLWSSLCGTDLLGPDERRHLAPEQRAGASGDARSDVYALGLVLLEALAGRLPDGEDPVTGLAAVRLTGPGGEKVPLPAPLAETLRRALASEPSARLPGMSDMRKEIDTLLFSGDFSPTTFDLAFFMHTLFREDMEREALDLEEARRADYREFLVEEKPRAVAPAGSAPVVSAEAEAATAAETPPPTSPVVTPPAGRVTASAAARPAITSPPEPFAPAREGTPKATTRDSAAREAASRLTFHRQVATDGRGRWLWLVGGLLAAAVLGGGAGYIYFVQSRTSASAPPSTTGAEAAAAARVRELEERIATLEREKAEAEARAAEDARQRLEAQAAAKGKSVDPAALQKAQEQARLRARAEQETKQQEEIARITEAKKAEEKRVAEAAPAPSPSAPPASAPPPSVPEGAATATPGAETAAVSSPPTANVPATPTAPPTASPSPTTTPTQPGELVEANDPRLVPPVVTAQVPARYPPLAQQRGVEGTVELSALIDETGRVVDVKIVRASPVRQGFEEAALQHVRSRRYRPATRDGVPIRVWMPIVVHFRLRR